MARPRKVMEQPAQADLPQPEAEVAQAVAEPLPAHHREHPEKLSGEALRVLAHRQGLSRSECDRLTDEKIREQLRYLAYRRAADDVAMV